MASGTIYSDWMWDTANSYRVRIDWWESNQSAVNNASIVNLYAVLEAYWDIEIGARSVLVNIDGNESYVTCAGAHGTGYFYSGTESAVVYHNSDGTRNVWIGVGFNVDASISGHGYIGTIYAGAAVALDALDRTAPSITSFTATPASTSSVTIAASTNVYCDSWDYKIDSGAWTNYSTTNSTSSSKTITGLTTDSHTVQIRARKWANNIYTSSSVVSFNLEAPIVDFSTTTTTTEATLSATSNVNCNVWKYSLDGGRNWTQFSTTNGKSASVTIQGLAMNTAYTAIVEAKAASNGVWGLSDSKSFRTLGSSILNSATNYYPDSGSTTLTFNWSVFISSYRHKLEIRNGSTLVQYCTFNNLSGDGTSVYNLTLSENQVSKLLDAVPSDSTYVMLTLVLTTYESYSGGTYGTQIGTESTMQIRVGVTKANSGIQASVSYADINSTTRALTNDASRMVRNASTAKITFTAIPRNGATIVSQTINGTPASVLEFPNVSVSTFTVEAVDSRGYTFKSTLRPTFVEYVVPTCIMSAERVAPVSSNQIYLLFSGRYYNGKFDAAKTVANTLTIEYRFKETTDSDYGSYVTVNNQYVSPTNTSYSNTNNYIPSTTFDYTKSYDIQLRVKDRINTVITNFVLPRGIPVFDWGKNDFDFHVDVHTDGDLSADGDSAFGGDLSVGGDVDITGSISLGHNSSIFVGSGTNSVDVALNDTEFAELTRLVADEYSSTAWYKKDEICYRKEVISSATYTRYYAAKQGIFGETWNASHWEEFPFFDVEF